MVKATITIIILTFTKAIFLMDPKMSLEKNTIVTEILTKGNGLIIGNTAKGN